MSVDQVQVPSTTPGHHHPGAESQRFALARLVRDAALHVPGVLATDPGAGARLLTVDRGRRLPGVVCVASPSGGYDVALGLRCDLVPLPPLGMTVEGAIRGAASRHGHRIDDVRIEIVDVRDPFAP